MPLMETPDVEMGRQAPDFSLPATDGKTYSLQDIARGAPFVVAFICNHCPYVKAVIDQMVADAKILQSEDIGFVAISANDTVQYPEDDFEHMKEFSAAHQFTFPYLWDESQSVAQDYGAVCTPDFFGFNAKGELQYRGRLNDTKVNGPKGASQDLLSAMREIASTGKGPAEQKASMGCNIKWKSDKAA